VPITTPTHTYQPHNHSTDSLIYNVPPFSPINANIIKDDNRLSDVNIFCFAAFADKGTGILYSNLTRTFPFMSLEGNICFLIVYLYKTDAILALPITGFSDNIIFCCLPATIQPVEIKRVQNLSQRNGQSGYQGNHKILR
jgi:hypothetical protein